MQDPEEAFNRRRKGLGSQGTAAATAAAAVVSPRSPRISGDVSMAASNASEDGTLRLRQVRGYMLVFFLQLYHTRGINRLCTSFWKQPLSTCASAGDDCGLSCCRTRGLNGRPSLGRFLGTALAPNRVLAILPQVFVCHPERVFVCLTEFLKRNALRCWLCVCCSCLIKTGTPLLVTAVAQVFTYLHKRWLRYMLVCYHDLRERISLSYSEGHRLYTPRCPPPPHPPLMPAKTPTALLWYARRFKKVRVIPLPFSPYTRSYTHAIAPCTRPNTHTHVSLNAFFVRTYRKRWKRVDWVRSVL